MTVEADACNLIFVGTVDRNRKVVVKAQHRQRWVPGRWRSHKKSGSMFMEMVKSLGSLASPGAVIQLHLCEFNSNPLHEDRRQTWEEKVGIH